MLLFRASQLIKVPGSSVTRRSNLIFSRGYSILASKKFILPTKLQFTHLPLSFDEEEVKKLLEPWVTAKFRVTTGEPGWDEKSGGTAEVEMEASDASIAAEQLNMRQFRKDDPERMSVKIEKEKGRFTSAISFQDLFGGIPDGKPDAIKPVTWKALERPEEDLDFDEEKAWDNEQLAAQQDSPDEDAIPANPEDLPPRNFLHELDGWLVHVKETYNIDIFGDYYNNTEKELLKDSGLESDTQAAEELRATREDTEWSFRYEEKPSQFIKGETVVNREITAEDILYGADDIDHPVFQKKDDSPNQQFLGKSNSLELYAHDQTCSNSVTPEIMKIAKEIAEKQPRAFIARNDWTLVSAPYVGENSIEMEVITNFSTEHELDPHYYQQYAYFLSLYLSRLFDISLDRLEVTVGETSNHSDTVIITIEVTGIVGEAGAFNPEIDTELGSLAGFFNEGEGEGEGEGEEDRVKEEVKDDKKEPVLLRRVDGKLCLDVNSFYSYASKLDKGGPPPEIKREIEDHRLIVDYAPGSNVKEAKE